MISSIHDPNRARTRQPIAVSTAIGLGVGYGPRPAAGGGIRT
jgi:hypothetical protein